METFSAWLAICAGNSPVPGDFPAQKPVTRSFDVFFDLRVNKRLSKQWWGWGFETPSHPLLSYCNDERFFHCNTKVDGKLVWIWFWLWLSIRYKFYTCHDSTDVWVAMGRLLIIWAHSGCVLITSRVMEWRLIITFQESDSRLWLFIPRRQIPSKGATYIRIGLHQNWTSSNIMTLTNCGSVTDISSLLMIYEENVSIISSRSGQIGHLFADDIFRCFILMKNFVFWLRFHFSLFLRVQMTITQHRFR